MLTRECSEFKQKGERHVNRRGIRKRKKNMGRGLHKERRREGGQEDSNFYMLRGGQKKNFCL